MTEQPKRRPSIHPDDGVNVDKETNEDLLICEDCTNDFLVNDKDGTEIPLTEKQHIEEYKNLQKKKKRESENDLPTHKTFKCKSCKIQAAGATARHVVSVPVTTISTYWKIAVACIGIFVALGWHYQVSSYQVYQDIQFIKIQVYQEFKFWITRQQDIPVKIAKQTFDDELLDKNLFKLENVYGNQIADTWITLNAGIKSVLQEIPNKPSMFLMLFDSDSAGTTAKCLAEAVSQQAIAYLFRKVGTPKIIYGAELDKKRLLDDPGLLLKDLKNPVQEKGALVVINLHDVPPKVAKMFHYVCDRYSPLVEKAVTFFTLKVDKMPSQKDLQTKAQETMSDLWSSVMEDSELKPLIKRMTSNIIRVYSESGCYGI